jgi:hypothetical protein
MTQSQPTHISQLPEYAQGLVAAARDVAPMLDVFPLPGSRLPATDRDLLDHRRDMTPTLERHHGATIYLDVLASDRRGDWYHRHSILRLQGSGRAVEFGLIRICLPALPPALHPQIQGNKVPLGTLLHRYRVPHVGSPGGFYLVTGLGHFAAALGISADSRCYARANRLLLPDTTVICELLEILPPAPA